jgi:uncharacterized Fe-S cluster protein YjdI
MKRRVAFEMVKVGTVLHGKPANRIESALRNYYERQRHFVLWLQAKVLLQSFMYSCLPYIWLATHHLHGNQIFNISHQMQPHCRLLTCQYMIDCIIGEPSRHNKHWRPGWSHYDEMQGEMIFNIVGRTPEYVTTSVWILMSLINSLQWFFRSMLSKVNS